jgi:hypothetical protein
MKKGEYIMQQPRYPIFVISKGRSGPRHTARTLEECGIDYRIVIEKEEYDQYAAVIDPKKILVLPFSNLGLGSIPVRNWVWEFSKSEGHKAHFIIDDNCRYLYRLHKNSKLRVKSAVPFRVCEDYFDRFENVGMAGLNYHFFAPTSIAKEPVYYNTRIYSCILIRNDLPFRWRILEWDGKPAPFNEDTDLSLQVLKSGMCTLLLNSFLIGKGPTMTTRGGNTDTVYKVGAAGFDNRYAFAASLAKAHPDVCEITQKHGRWHHNCNYSGFQKFNKLKLKPGATWPEEYPTKLKLVKLDDPKNMNSTYTDANLDDVLMEIEQ